MSPLVLDNSILVAWLLGEDNPRVAHAIDLLKSHQGTVPLLWAWEFANMMVVMQRRGKLSAAPAAEASAIALDLGLMVDQTNAAHIWGPVASAATAYGLTASDAAYLELAMRRGAPLATLDEALRRAALACELTVV